MAAKKQNWAKCKVWLENATMEMEGPHMACAIEIFSTLTIEKKKIALEKMNERLQGHIERDTKEAEPTK